MIETLGTALVRAAVALLLPDELRRAWGEELVLHFRDRQRRFRSRWGALALPLLWAAEIAGLLATAWRARRPDAWTRRTDPVRGATRSPHAASPAPRSRTPEPAALMDQLAQDLRFALRSYRRRPGMTALAVASLALGIGASTAMFSVVDSVLLRPLPFDAPEELVHVYPTNPSMAGHPTLGAAAVRGTFSRPEAWAVMERQRVFESIATFYTWGGATLAGDDGRPERIELVRGSPDLLATLGLEPVRGRAFGPEDDPGTGARSVMLTERFWRERFAGDPDAVGREIRLSGQPYTVIGIVPDEARHETTVDRGASWDADVWTLITGSSTEGNWGNHDVTNVVARLRDGVTVEQAREEVARILSELPEDADHGHAASVFPAEEDTTRNVRGPLVLLVVGAVALLVVGCGNVAALLLGAGIDREREIAVRGALGAGRSRLSRQLLTESLALAGVGALAGIVLAAGLHEVLLQLAPPDVPRLDQASVDGRALGFAVTVSVLAGILFGTVPALGLSRPELASSISASRGSTAKRSRLQSAVVVGELALATVLLVSAALLGRTLFALERVDVGFDSEGLWAVSTALPTWDLRVEDDAEATRAAVDGYFQEVVDAVGAVPGVAGVAVASNIPLGAGRSNNDVTPEGWDAEAEGENLIAERRFVSDTYFDVTGIRIVEGRGFEPADNRDDGAQVLIVSEGLARRAWPDEPAVGKRMSFWGLEPYTVIGVAADLRDESLDRTTSYAYYVPFRQVQAQSGALLLRVEGDPAVVLPAVRERIWAAPGDLTIVSTESLDALQSAAVSDQRYRARLMVFFALTAALFALMGVYGVVARSVARRTREMGVRTALGAKARDIRRLVVGQGVRLALLGAVIGVALSLWATRFLADMLYGVEPVDWLTLVGIALFVGAASLAASLPPSRRATRVDPREALRAE